MIRSIPMVLVTLICVIALAFGLIRIGVSLLLALQVLGVIDVETFREPVMEIQQFLNVQNGGAIISLSTFSYLVVISLMGLCLVLGSILSWLRKPWGYSILSLYLSMHAGLFVNFQTINPKIFILIGGVTLFVILILLNQRRPLEVSPVR